MTKELGNDPSTLEREGWERRTIASKPRLAEIVSTYRQLGFEVRVVPLELDHLEGCNECFKGDVDGYQVIYTRKMPPECSNVVSGEPSDKNQVSGSLDDLY